MAGHLSLTWQPGFMLQTENKAVPITVGFRGSLRLLAAANRLGEFGQNTELMGDWGLITILPFNAGKNAVTVNQSDRQPLR
jgi:hypothetical protein